MAQLKELSQKRPDVQIHGNHHYLKITLQKPLLKTDKINERGFVFKELCIPNLILFSFPLSLPLFLCLSLSHTFSVGLLVQSSFKICLPHMSSLFSSISFSLSVSFSPSHFLFICLFLSCSLYLSFPLSICGQSTFAHSSLVHLLQFCAREFGGLKFPLPVLALVASTKGQS